MKILIACEESQTVCKAFRARGHEAYSCDILPSSGGHPEWHIQKPLEDIIGDGGEWDMIIAFPDCTYITVTANKWLKDQPQRKSGALVGEARRQAREYALAFVCMILNRKCDKISIENPVGCISTRIKLIDGVYTVMPEGKGDFKPTQIVQPFQFGHPEPKKTCLWLKGLPVLQPTNIVEQEPYHVTQSGKNMPKWYAYADKSKGQSERARIRSKTFPGIRRRHDHPMGLIFLPVGREGVYFIFLSSSIYYICKATLKNHNKNILKLRGFGFKAQAFTPLVSLPGPVTYF